MSHVAMRNSKDVSVAPSGRATSMGRALAVVAAMCFSLSACETMRNTMDSINVFGDGNANSASVDASSAGTKSDPNADPRKHAVMRAGVQAVAPDSVSYYMDQQEASLRKQLSGTDVAVTRIGQTIILSMPGSATFSSGSSSMESKIFPVLDSVIVVLDEFNQTYVDVVGHTDSTGPEQYNLELSLRRSESVRDYMKQNGISITRLSVKGEGEGEPLVSNKTRAGRAVNRRVEFETVK